MCCCLCSLKGFSTRVKTTFTYVIASLFPAASKPLIMESFLVFEMIACLNSPPSMKRFQITQFEGYFYIARCNSVWQLFANAISILCVELVWDKFLCWLIGANIQMLELFREIVWNDSQLTVIFCTFSFLRCLSLWKYP